MLFKDFEFMEKNLVSSAVCKIRLFDFVYLGDKDLGEALEAVGTVRSLSQVF